MTADAVSVKIGRTPNQTAARLLELREGGYVMYARGADGKRVVGKTRTGNGAYIQMLTGAGRQVVEPMIRHN